VFEASGGVEADDGFAEDGFEAQQVFVGFGEFGAGVAEEVLDVGCRSRM